MADYIPFELQTKILKGLPTKTLMRFRSVSKPYKSLIDSSKFIADYSFNHTHQQHLLVRYIQNLSQHYVSFVDDDTFSQQKVSLPVSVTGRATPEIIDSVQGLFCLCQYVAVDMPTGLKINIVLWNPSIRKSVSVVVPDTPLQQVCDTLIGFGICPHTRDPKIVRIYYLRASLPTPWHVEVYTLSSRAWRSISTITQPHKTVSFMLMQVATDEFVYWLASDGIGRNTPYIGRIYMIMSFDLVSEKLMEVSLPDCLFSEGLDDVVLSKLKDSLVVLEVRRKAEKYSYGVWKMEHGVPNTFTKLYTIYSPDASIRFIYRFSKNNEPIFAKTTSDNLNEPLLEPLNSPGVSRQGGVLVQKLHLEHNYVLISGKAYNFTAWSYIETLLLLDH